MLGASDYQLNLHPPEEDTQDVLDSLDSVMAVSMRCIGVGIMSRVCVCAYARVFFCGCGCTYARVIRGVCRQLEEVKRKAEEDDFVAAKQKMLNAEKARIQ